MALRGRVHLIRRAIALLPELLAGQIVERRDDFLVADPRENEPAGARDDRRRTSGPNRALPDLARLVGPGRRR